MKRKKAHELRERFTGRPPDTESVIELQDMKTLTVLGSCVAVEYREQKHGDRKAHVYRHEFESGQILLTNGKDLIIHGDTEITEKGIEG